MKKASILFAALLIVSLESHAQNSDDSQVLHALPFLLINPDLQTFGMGGAGVSVPNFYSNAGFYHNPALLAQNEKFLNINLSYLPWLRKQVPDINLANLAAAWGFKKNHALGFNLTYFSLGDITFTDNVGNVIGNFRPNEFAISLKYSAILSDNFNIGVGAKYINSNLTGGISVEGAASKAANALALDLGFDYRDEMGINDKHKLRWSVGFALTNMGNKVSYISTSQKDFIPAQIKLGGSVTLRKLINDNHYMAFDLCYQADKLLAPTSPRYARDSVGNLIPDGNGGYAVESGMNPNVSEVQGMLQSFYDAPGGGKEELNEITHRFGFAFRDNYRNEIYYSVRLGYSYQNPSKRSAVTYSPDANETYFTLGAGGGYKKFYLDLFYLLPTTQRHPLENTLGFSLGFKMNFEDKKKPFKEN